MISKELLDEITKDFKKTLVTNIELDSGNAIIWDYGDEKKEINIHELVHLCKMYAAKNGYIIESHLRVRDDREIEGISRCWGGSYSKYTRMDFSEDTEVEAVIKATEWVYSILSDL